MLKKIIDKEHDGLTLHSYLRDELLFSRRMLKAIKMDGGKIVINGVSQTLTYQIKIGDCLEVYFPPEKKGYYMTPENIQLDFIYEDQYIIVLNKQPNMITAPTPLHPTGTVANGLLYYYEKNDIDRTVHIVTRLDRDTSGLLLIAKNRYIHSLFSKELLGRHIKRKYVAVVEGLVQNKQGTIVANIGRKKDSIIERTVTDEGKEAITHFKVEQKTKTHTLMNVELETGRTHQIRVHFSHIGHPLAGDTLYGGKTTYIERHALHCSSLSFNHPITNEKMFFYLPIPEDMMNVILVTS